MSARPMRCGRRKTPSSPASPDTRERLRLPPPFCPCHDASCSRIRMPMRVFSVPPSAPFLRTLITALVDGRLVDGFNARMQPERLAQATLYLPTRRAGRMAREIFLDVLATDAVVLP